MKRFVWGFIVGLCFSLAATPLQFFAQIARLETATASCEMRGTRAVNCALKGKNTLDDVETEWSNRYYALMQKLDEDDEDQ